MWRVGLNRAVKEVRFVIRRGPEHHGTWYFVNNDLQELRRLNPNTFFSVCEMNESYKTTQSTAAFIFGDLNETTHEVKTDNMTPAQWEAEFKRAVDMGGKLERPQVTRNFDRDLPLDIVEARKYRKYMDDGF